MQEGMGSLRKKAAEYQCKESNRLLNEHFINGINDDGMADEILKEEAMLEDIQDTLSDCVLLWAHMLEAQRWQQSALNDIKEVKTLT